MQPYPRARREKRSLLKKMNMLIGTFFGEVGSDLLRKLPSGVEDKDQIRAELAPLARTEPQFAARALLTLRIRVGWLGSSDSEPPGGVCLGARH